MVKVSVAPKHPPYRAARNNINANIWQSGIAIILKALIPSAMDNSRFTLNLMKSTHIFFYESENGMLDVGEFRKVVAILTLSVPVVYLLHSSNLSPYSSLNKFEGILFLIFGTVP